MQQRDHRKQVISKRHGVTLIVVPYWWDATEESLAQTLHLARPDILLPVTLLKGDPIPSQIQLHQRKGTL